MNQKHRLMCESWVEKRPEISQITAYGTSTRKQSIKWKTRYAMLIVACDTHMSEIRFYQKKPRSYTEITDDVIKLQPWQYIVDIPSWIVDKGRPHVLRLRLLPESVIPGQHFRIQIAYQSSEETTAWMRCIQNQTKLTSGIQGHSFGVVAEESSATARIGIAGKHCLLFVSPHKVILAHKTDRSVVCVWPFETIRNYASDDDRRLVIEAGRCAPLGEGVYSFRTRENDDNVIFDLFDHYTTEAAEELENPKSKIKRSPSHQCQEQSKSAPANVSSFVESSHKSRKIQKKSHKKHHKPMLEKSSILDSTTDLDEEPPEKPPLPQNRATMSLVSIQSDPAVETSSSQATSSTKMDTEVPGIVLKEKNIKMKIREDSPFQQKQPKSKADATNAVNRDSVTKGLYDLDKLLYSLESTIHLSQDNIPDISGYDLPTAKHGENPELAYAVNTIKSNSSIEPQYSSENNANGSEDLEISPTNSPTVQNDEIPKSEPVSPMSPYDNIPSSEIPAAERKQVKPKIAPKPPSIKLPGLTPRPYKVALAGPKQTPPYAKVDTGRKKLCA